MRINRKRYQIKRAASCYFFSRDPGKRSKTSLRSIWKLKLPACPKNKEAAPMETASFLWKVK